MVWGQTRVDGKTTVTFSRKMIDGWRQKLWRTDCFITAFRSTFCFLGATKHLYKRVCPSVRLSVHRSVQPSVRPPVRPWVHNALSLTAEKRCFVAPSAVYLVDWCLVSTCSLREKTACREECLIWKFDEGDCRVNLEIRPTRSFGKNDMKPTMAFEERNNDAIKIAKKGWKAWELLLLV